MIAGLQPAAFPLGDFAFESELTTGNIVLELKCVNDVVKRM